MSVLEIKSNLLAKALWSLNDIMEYAECSKTTASKIRKEAITKYDGLIPIMPRKTKRDAILKVLGVVIWQINNGHCIDF